MVELSVIRDLVTIFGVLAGFSYYVMTVRNNEKTRKMQTLMQLSNSRINLENYRLYWKIMKLEWDTIEDYLEKYSPLNNEDQAAENITVWSVYDSLGILLRENMVDDEIVYRMVGRRIIQMWFKFEAVFKQNRARLSAGPGVNFMEEFEFLANEMINLSQRKRHPLPVQWLHPTSTLHEKYT
jgi:hypothetical protein